MLKVEGQLLQLATANRRQGQNSSQERGEAPSLSCWCCGWAKRAPYLLSIGCGCAVDFIQVPAVASQLLLFGSFVLFSSPGQSNLAHYVQQLEITTLKVSVSQSGRGQLSESLPGVPPCISF